MDLKGKVAVITGSSSGVGRAAAIQFARKGCDVVINYRRDAENAADVATQCKAVGVQAIVVQADVSRNDDCRNLIRAAEDAFGRLDVLVNNAGFTQFVTFANLDGLTEEIWERTLRTNVLGPFFCTRAAVPLMRRNGGGSIINVASIAGLLGLGSSIAYAASKAAMINMTRCLARALGPQIRVNAVAPGAIDTRWLRDGMGEKAFENLLVSLHDTTPLQTISFPDDVADAILWLAGGARMITGEVIIIDGGYHLGPGARLTPKEESG